jgi:hypothetical protein
MKKRVQAVGEAEEEFNVRVEGPRVPREGGKVRRLGGGRGLMGQGRRELKTRDEVVKQRKQSEKNKVKNMDKKGRDAFRKSHADEGAPGRRFPMGPRGGGLRSAAPSLLTP